MRIVPWIIKIVVVRICLWQMAFRLLLPQYCRYTVTEHLENLLGSVSSISMPFEGQCGIGFLKAHTGICIGLHQVICIYLTMVQRYLQYSSNQTSTELVTLCLSCYIHSICIICSFICGVWLDIFIYLGCSVTRNLTTITTVDIYEWKKDLWMIVIVNEIQLSLKYVDWLNNKNNEFVYFNRLFTYIACTHQCSLKSYLTVKKNTFRLLLILCPVGPIRN